VLDANRELAEQRLGDRDVIREPLRQYTTFAIAPWAIGVRETSGS
jgi:hypothetical protein